jgi:hypothetical protein
VRAVLLRGRIADDSNRGIDVRLVVEGAETDPQEPIANGGLHLAGGQPKENRAGIVDCHPDNVTRNFSPHGRR